MNGIILVNDSLRLFGKSSRIDSLNYQLHEASQWIQINNLEIIKLNPYQVNHYYTIPHALLYDLKRRKAHLDVFLFYSECVVSEFVDMYPESWEQICNHFVSIFMIKR